MRRFSVLDWSLEQRWMIILLIFLVFYNSKHASLLSTAAHSCDRLPFTDPFYPITFLSNSSFPALVDGILQASFLCVLLLFWLSVYHGIRQVSQLLTSKAETDSFLRRILAGFFHSTCPRSLSSVFFGSSPLYCRRFASSKNFVTRCTT